MTARDLCLLADAACSDHEDGDTGVLRCCLIYCEEHGLSEEVAYAAAEAAGRQGALEAGIPQSVIDGRTRLTDHFSAAYIADQLPRGRQA